MVTASGPTPSGPASSGPPLSGPAPSGLAPSGFAALPDLASRQLGGSVVFATDELFAEKENLIKSEDPVFEAGTFGPRGKTYDGWETRRRRQPGHDHAIVRLGIPGIVHGVVVDTAHFRGNYPPQISVDAVSVAGYPSPAELAGLSWESLVGRADALGDTANRYPVADPRHWTHLRLSIYPDGGVARFRVHGDVLPDPAFLTGTVDLAALENGGRLLECSDAFYSSAANLIMPGRAQGMGEGWENARRRGPGNDYAVFGLAAAGVLRCVEIDTTWFVGNSPGSVQLQADDGSGMWSEVLPPTRVQPDTRHRFVIASPDAVSPDAVSPDAVSQNAVSRVRLDVFPDGGLARLRVHGEIVPEALAALRRRWLETDAPPIAQPG